MTPPYKTTSCDIELLDARCRGLAQQVRRLVERGQSAPAVPCTLGAIRDDVIVCTGIGLAEGVARYAVAVWGRYLGLNIRFEPITSVALNQAHGDRLVMFSQGLSPNAQMAMAKLPDYARGGWLMTSLCVEDDHDALVRWQRDGGDVFKGDPGEAESGFLLRVLGPALGRVAVSQWCAQWLEQSGEHGLSWPQQLTRLPQAMQEAFECGLARAMDLDDVAPLMDSSLTLLTLGMPVDMVQGVYWKWIEGLWDTRVLHADLLQWVHGAYQGSHHQQTFAIVMTPDDEISRGFVRRFSSVYDTIDGGKKQWVWVTSTLSQPLDCFEYEAWSNGMILGLCRRLDRVLSQWPGKAEDGALYKLNCVDDVRHFSPGSATLS